LAEEGRDALSPAALDGDLDSPLLNTLVLDVVSPRIRRSSLITASSARAASPTVRTLLSRSPVSACHSSG